MANHWLMKSEPAAYSWQQLVKDKRTHWNGVRNHQAALNLKAMKVGDLAFFYHSNCDPPAIVGVVQVVREGYPDATQFDPTSDYYDAKSTPDKPRWVQIDVALVRKTRLLPLREMRAAPELATMRVLATGNRLSITPVTPEEWRAVNQLLSR